MTTIRFTLSTATHYGQDRTAVNVSHSDVEELLGRPHRGTPEDDEAVTKALLDSGAPAWAETAEGVEDEDNWIVVGPVLKG